LIRELAKLAHVIPILHTVMVVVMVEADPTLAVVVTAP
jgi:hypothetical protein